MSLSLPLYSFSLVTLTLPLLITPRDITFPPSLSKQSPLNGIGAQTPGLPGHTNPFAGLTTFANLPFVPCLADVPNEEVQRFDVAFLGAPFDTGTTARPGARFGPEGIRRGSRRIEPDFATSIYTGANAFHSWAKVVDCGDAPLTFLDNTVALKQLDEANELVSSRSTNSTEFTTPRIITLGGDHTITLPALRSAFKRWGQVSVIHFDSHLDTWDPEVLGGGISHYAGINHGTFLHIAHEEGLIRNSSLHVGIRAPVFGQRDVRNDRRCGFEIVKARDIDRVSVHGVIDSIKRRVAGSRVYISVDIDVLDPAFAPATGTAEVGGWSTRELLSILDGLVGLEVVGADVVEVAPIYDNPGETTLLAAAEVAHSLLKLMVQQPVKSLDQGLA